MKRCLQLAVLAAGDVAPNPMVGAVLVYQSRIIGEGHHQQYGLAHAEVNCLASVAEPDRPLMALSTLYVSLEPCAHWGKTPPCADLIIRHRIPKVVVGCRDPFDQVNGKGIEKLRAAGVEVVQDVLAEECRQLNRRFFTYHVRRRPYIRLKWAQTSDGKIAGKDSSRLLISNAYTARLVHKWRSEEMAILVGTNTALFDNPQLSTRHWPGHNPVRVVVDAHLRLPHSLAVFDGKIPTLVFNTKQHNLPLEKPSLNSLGEAGIGYYQVKAEESLVCQILHGLFQLHVQSVLVEGGTRLLQSFIDEGLWDEAQIITNENLLAENGLPAPQLHGAVLVDSLPLFSDFIRTYQPAQG